MSTHGRFAPLTADLLERKGERDPEEPPFIDRESTPAIRKALRKVDEAIASALKELRRRSAKRASGREAKVIHDGVLRDRDSD